MGRVQGVGVLASGADRQWGYIPGIMHAMGIAMGSPLRGYANLPCQPPNNDCVIVFRSPLPDGLSRVYILLATYVSFPCVFSGVYRQATRVRHSFPPFYYRSGGAGVTLPERRACARRLAFRLVRGILISSLRWSLRFRLFRRLICFALLGENPRRVLSLLLSVPRTETRRW